MRRAGLLEVSALAASVCLFSRCGPAPAVSFGVLADCQFAAAPAAGSRFYSYSWLKLREALELFNARGVRFVVHLGDLIDHDAQSYDLILLFAAIHTFRGRHAPFAITGCFCARIVGKQTTQAALESL